MLQIIYVQYDKMYRSRMHVSEQSTHTVRFVCVLKTAPQFSAIRHCAWAGAPGALCVCSVPCGEIAVNTFPLLSVWLALVSSFTLSTIRPSPTERNTVLHSQHPVYCPRLGRRARTKRLLFSWRRALPSIPCCLWFPCLSLSLDWIWPRKTRCLGVNWFYSLHN